MEGANARISDDLGRYTPYPHLWRDRCGALDIRLAGLFLDPAVYVSADGEGILASVIERLQLIEPIGELEAIDYSAIWDASPEEAPIAVLVVDGSGGSVFRVPDPRTAPGQWPWMGLEGEEE